MFVAAAPDAGTQALWLALHSSLPLLRLFATSTLATQSFLTATAPAASASYVTSPLLPLAALSLAPARGRCCVPMERLRHGAVTALSASTATEAMSSVLAAINHAFAIPPTGSTFCAPTGELGWRDSAIGRYRVGSNGDSSLTRLEGYRVGTGGQLVPAVTLNG